MISRDRFSDLIEIYALDALEPDECLEVKTHLVVCKSCRSQLDAVRAATTELVPDSRAPAHVWTRITAELDRNLGPSHA